MSPGDVNGIVASCTVGILLVPYLHARAGLVLATACRRKVQDGERGKETYPVQRVRRLTRTPCEETDHDEEREHKRHAEGAGRQNRVDLFVVLCATHVSSLSKTVLNGTREIAGDLPQFSGEGREGGGRMDASHLFLHLHPESLLLAQAMVFDSKRLHYSLCGKNERDDPRFDLDDDYPPRRTTEECFRGLRYFDKGRREETRREVGGMGWGGGRGVSY